MLLFENPGLINEDAATVLGVNVKGRDDPIGQFGTGIKYAIAMILRLGGEIEIWRGRKLLRFAATEKTIRGKKFSVVVMNGRKLGFTTDYGAHWEPWMAYRELWSNCRDESGTVRRIEPDDFVVRTGRTQIVVRCTELERAHEERHRIVLQTEPLVTMPGMEIHAGISEYVYYRSIRVARVPTTAKRSMYTYNLTGDHPLTEDRTLRHAWMLDTDLARGLVQCTNSAILGEVLSSESHDGTSTGKFAEGLLPYSSVKDVKPSPQFLEMAEQLEARKKLTAGAASLFNHYREELPGYVSPYLIRLTDAERAIEERALELIRSAGISAVADDFLYKSRLGYGDRVSVSRRDGMAIGHEQVLAGHVNLAECMLEAYARLAGGSLIQQLCRFALSRTFDESKRNKHTRRVGEIADTEIPL